MSMLITGGSGFIGGYFVNKYRNKYDIDAFSFQRDDFDALDLQGVDIILHLSALVHQMNGASKDDYEKINVIQTLDLANRAKLDGVKHFIFMSTIKVYGEETDYVYTEESKCDPQDAYGVSKLKAEQELKKIEDDNFIVSIIRTPIVYGYGVKANIKNLVSLINKVPVLPFGAIENKRSMVYIGNLCHLIDSVCEQRKRGVFLACDDESLSTTRLIKLIAGASGKKVYLLKVPFFENLLKLLKPSFYKRLYGNLQVDNRITKNSLDFNNEFSVEDGIKLMIKGEKV